MRYRFPILAALVLALLAGCVDAAGLPMTSAPGPTTPALPLSALTTPGPDPAATAAASDAAEDLSTYLPGGEGFRWTWTGFAEYGHTLTLRFIQQSGEERVYLATGEVFDMSDGESDRDFSLAVAYVTRPGVLLQRVAGPMMMDVRYNEVELLRAPVTKGAQWTQAVTSPEGWETTLQCTIDDVKDVNGHRTAFVTYEDTATGYQEKREIAHGVGVVAYERYYLPEGMEQGEMIGYRLLEGPTAHAAALTALLPPLDTEQQWFGLAEYGHIGRLSLVSSDDAGAVYRFNGIYHDGIGTEDAFAVRYDMDFSTGTVTEHVEKNDRTGSPVLNSPLSGLVVLQLPLYVGASWTTTATLSGEPCVVQARVVSISDKGAVRVGYIVEDTPGYWQDRYLEERVYEPGLGLTGFSSLLPGDIGLSQDQEADPAAVRQALANHMFGYSLRR